MPKVTEEHRQARREQILEAALNCFIKNGFHRTTMKDICREAGLSAGAVYLHFSSKEDIIEASWKSIYEARAAYIDTVKQTSPALRALNEVWDDYERRLTEADTNKAWQLWIQLLSEALRNPRIRESIRRNWDDGEKHAVGLIRHAQEQGEIDEGLDRIATARVWQAVHDGLILLKIIDPEQDVQKYFQAYRALLSNLRKTTSAELEGGRGRPDDD